MDKPQKLKLGFAVTALTLGGGLIAWNLWPDKPPAPVVLDPPSPTPPPAPGTPKTAGQPPLPAKDYGPKGTRGSVR
jgi:hypothetical protein